MADSILAIENRADATRIPLLVGATPLLTLKIVVGGRTATLRLKLEWFNPCGSIKDRTAVSLYDSVADQLDPDVGIVESTSGNLGVALAAITNSEGVPFTAVVDPRTPVPAISAMSRLGARVVTVSEKDGHGGFLLSRLKVVRQLLADHPGMVWTNQYRNPANPRVHELRTAPELADQARPDSVVLVPVSTGGTLGGLLAYARRATNWTMIGVDVHGSYALGYTNGVRVLSGIGSSLKSTFVSADDCRTMRVDAADAVSACVWLLEESGIGVGASSGALVAAALRVIETDGVDNVVCVCPDGAKNYLDTVYAEAWRSRMGITPLRIPARCESVDWGSRDGFAIG